jgi:hypothetical protein
LWDCILEIESGLEELLVLQIWHHEIFSSAEHIEQEIFSRSLCKGMWYSMMEA